MEFGFLEYFLVAFIAIVAPVWGVIGHRQMMERLANVPNARIAGYRKTMMVEWIVVAIVLVVWLGGGERLAALGLGFETGWAFWVFGGLTLVACVLSIVQAITITRSEKKLADVSEQLRSLAPMVPHNDRESQWWVGLSVTAGICEEIIYRGFMITTLAVLFGPWPAVGLSSLAFGLAHAYQGPKGVLKVFAIGLTMGALFVLSGSLWAPIVLHIVIDLASGYLGRQAVARVTAASPATV